MLSQKFSTTVFIHRSAADVWKLLTDFSHLKNWMEEPGNQLRFETSWEKGSPFRLRAFHHELIENKGTVLENIPGKILAYDYLSSISNLPDVPENRTRIDFVLEEKNAGTQLTIAASGFPTESIYKHVALYWQSTANILKQYAEA